MQIYVYRPEGNLGPYSPFDLRSMVQGGLIRADELGWEEGMAEWQPLSTFVPLAKLPPIPGPLPAATVRTGSLEPFLAAQIVGSTPAADEGMRREYLSHEASIRSVGLLYYFGGASGLILFVLAFTNTIHATGLKGLVVLALMPVLTVINLFLGYGLRTLNPKVLVPITILSALGMLGFPEGSVINGYIL